MSKHDTTADIKPKMKRSWNGDWTMCSQRVEGVRQGRAGLRKVIFRRFTTTVHPDGTSKKRINNSDDVNRSPTRRSPCGPSHMFLCSSGLTVGDAQLTERSQHTTIQHHPQTPTTSLLYTNLSSDLKVTPQSPPSPSAPSR